MNTHKMISYVGYTKNLTKRLRDHNSCKGAKFTRGRKWNLIYKETYKTKSLAMKKEYRLKKNYSLRKKIKENFLYEQKKYIRNSSF